MISRYDILNSILRLHSYLVSVNFKGYEFDDFLGSPIINLLTFNNLLLKRIAIQVGELLPFNLRPLLNIKKMDSFKARAFLAEGSALLYEQTHENIWKEFIINHILFLRNNYNKKYKGFSWGNHFDFASRGGFIKKYTPTIVWTSKVADACYVISRVVPELKQITDEIIFNCALFIQDSLERIEDETGICFAYAPGLLLPIHNSNLLGASTLAKAISLFPEKFNKKILTASINWSLKRINNDGSWYYGDEKKFHWIDNFHTAYVIDCLLDIWDLDNSYFDFLIIEKTVKYWLNNFFTDEGICKYYSHKIYPIDIQSVAQSIETLSKLHKYFPNTKNILLKVLKSALINMQNPDGSFIYQIRKFYRNKIPYIHWGQSTMFAALAHSLRVIG